MAAQGPHVRQLAHQQPLVHERWTLRQDPPQNHEEPAGVLPGGGLRVREGPVLGPAPALSCLAGGAQDRPLRRAPRVQPGEDAERHRPHPHNAALQALRARQLRASARPGAAQGGDEDWEGVPRDRLGTHSADVHHCGDSRDAAAAGGAAQPAGCRRVQPHHGRPRVRQEQLVHPVERDPRRVPRGLRRPSGVRRRRPGRRLVGHGLRRTRPPRRLRPRRHEAALDTISPQQSSSTSCPSAPSRPLRHDHPLTPPPLRLADD